MAFELLVISMEQIVESRNASPASPDNIYSILHLTFLLMISHEDFSELLVNRSNSLNDVNNMSQHLVGY